MTNNFKQEFSAGCVVYKKQPATSNQQPVFFLLGKHSGYHKWVLAKGLIEEGEKGWETALRETREEMGVKAKLKSKKPILKIQYYYVADLLKLKIKNEKLKTPYYAKASKGRQKLKNSQPTRRIEKYQEDGGGKTKIFKTVTFYLAEYKSGKPEDHDWEMSEAGWFSYDDALNLMSFKGEKEALEKAVKLITLKA